MNTDKLVVAVKEGKLQKVGTIEEVKGCNVYIRYAIKGGKAEMAKFHMDNVTVLPKMFRNDVEANKWKKENGFRKTLAIPAERIAVRYSQGNMKLQDTETVTFRQWNIPAVLTCPFRTEQCEKNCYALKAERIYPTVKARRKISVKATTSKWFVEAMIEQIEADLASTDKTIMFRIHESGDFYSVAYFQAWAEIANHFKGNRKIVFMAYTKSVDFVKEAVKNKAGYKALNMTIKFSEWEDTKQEEIEKASELGLTKFTAMDKGTIEREGYFACPSSEVFANTEKERHCGECKVCYFAEKNVAIEIH
ncbi:hypothetical protein CON44_18435 [Bacillus cereus]|nr:hypothetical protein CON44_18435 [Bacillus cereus]